MEIFGVIIWKNNLFDILVISLIFWLVLNFFLRRNFICFWNCVIICIGNLVFIRISKNYYKENRDIEILGFCLLFIKYIRLRSRMFIFEDLF